MPIYKISKAKSRVKDIQTDLVIQAHPDERTHLTNTEVTSSNKNETSHVMNKENRPPDKERDKPPPPSQTPTNSQKSKTSVFIIGDTRIKEVDGYLLTSSLKHQYLVQAHRNEKNSGGLSIIEYCRRPWLVNEENVSFQIV